MSKETVYTIKMDASEAGKLRWLLSYFLDREGNNKQWREECEAMLIKLPKP